MDGTWLILQADDLGACPAITDGILAAHAEGLVTQASVIMPASDSARALGLARRSGLPVGVHLALMCEWEVDRWPPLTAAPSLRGADGALLPGLTELRRSATRQDTVDELRAQVAAAAAAIDITHLDSHIGVCDADWLSHVAAESGLPSRDPVPPPGRTLALDSLWHLSLRPADTKTDDLIAYVTGLGPGVHMIVAHPALDGPDLRALCSPASRRWKWAVDIRLSDLASLRDPRFLRACTDRGVALTSVAAMARAGGGTTMRTP